MALLVQGRAIKICAFTLAVIMAASLVSAEAQEDAMAGNKLQLNAQTIKAGLVYNFLKYTTWAGRALPQEKERLKVCLFGNSPASSYLFPLEGKTAQQYVIALEQKSSISSTVDCNAIFIDAGEKDDLPDLLEFLKGKNILTLSDMSQFSSLGGMVELATVDRKVVLYINKKALDKAGLSIQSRLLNLGKMVSGG
jgi:hypothetical protein